MSELATLEDVEKIWRKFKNAEERDRAKELISIVSDSLREEAIKYGKDIDLMANSSATYASVVKSVIVDVIARTLMTSTDAEPMTQISESALGYSMSGTYLVPGGGLFIKKSELSRLGLRRQRLRTIELYGENQGN
jgi:hypothetical protein|nr:phage Gp19/Gp15/Gp42 family protein [uncultured Lachnoanaerobaculum sp.]DAY25644.1 MAG TPA: hypothetical protein [Caudoviricetes sp.]